MSILQTIFDFIDMLIFRIVLPIGIIILVISGIVIAVKFLKMKGHLDSTAARYQNPTQPDGYRVSDGNFMCSNCDYSCRSTSENKEWYCQKHQIDTEGTYVCDNYHTCLFNS